MTETYTASTVVDIIDALPTMFGFVPEESFIGIVTNGPRHGFGIRLRMDMPTPAHMAECGKTIANHLTQNAGDGVVLIALSNDHQTSDALTQIVIGHLADTPIVAALRADDRQVWTYGTGGVIDETKPALPRDKDATSVAVATAVAIGMRIETSRAAMEATFAPADNQITVTDDVDQIGLGEVGELTSMATDVIAVYETHRLALSDEEIRTLATAAQIVGTRDALWGMMNHSNARAHAEVWLTTATQTAGPEAAGPYALAGFGFWLSGDGARASIAVERAMGANPAHSLAGLVQMAIVLALDPKTWTGIPQ